jgi:hypothetical protein
MKKFIHGIYIHIEHQVVSLENLKNLVKERKHNNINTISSGSQYHPGRHIHIIEIKYIISF